MGNRDRFDLKRAFFVSIAVIIIIGTLYLCLADCLRSKGARADILFQDGSVLIKKSGSEGWLILTDDIEISEGDEITTGDFGTVELELPGESFFKVGPKSHIAIKEMGSVEITRRSENRFELVYGKVRALVAPFVNRRSNFIIETDNAAIGVRGTDFGVIKEEKTELLCLDGTLELVSKLGGTEGGKPIIVESDEYVSFEGTEIPQKPERLDEDFKNRFLMEMAFRGFEARGMIKDELKEIEPYGKDEEESTTEPEIRHYTIGEGDMLWKISEEYYGDGGKYPIIFEANREVIENPDLIYSGEVIVIPSHK